MTVGWLVSHQNQRTKYDLSITSSNRMCHSWSCSLRITGKPKIIKAVTCASYDMNNHMTWIPPAGTTKQWHHCHAHPYIPYQGTDMDNRNVPNLFFRRSQIAARWCNQISHWVDTRWPCNTEGNDNNVWWIGWTCHHQSHTIDIIIQ